MIIFLIRKEMEDTCNTNIKLKNIKEFLKSWNFWRPYLGVLAGGIAGFLYYQFVGCSSGSCFITSHSYSTIIFGGLSGYLITSGPCTRCWQNSISRKCKITLLKVKNDLYRNKQTIQRAGLICMLSSCGGAINYSEARTGEVCVDLGSGRGIDALRLTE